ncbi:hypothetical protein [Providencia alcalifaciens]|uniref:hypothetical protein n=1 Tax=Providencia alcalifaciens TaxID=126385 RepID=UPI001CC67C9A|nr:hypothetical protein NVI2019_OHEONHNH_01613 [Providencia alcalifaciens]CAG9418887.1 hypothetical protein NVI2019_PLFLNFOB_01708 [Providencia alcalifaciens]CAG9422128.1 hypothetical protein NVI2019_KOLGMIGM_02109 [Providencia alcalifaciens]CAG9423131.1 hypothetical protein NVI2019_OGMBKCAO_02109 [Providencia alcalifaciens]CAG9423388.1 hypothetical protein NVI2019_ANGEOOBF_02108 [Providencia alcalifaciens]
MDKSRQQFEEWRSKNKSSTINLFDVWQASRESLEIELPSHKGVHHSEYQLGYFDGVDKCKKLLISNGVKIKNG